MAYQVFLLDGIRQIAEVTAFESVEAIETDLARGSWVLRILRSQAPAVVEEARKAVWLGIEIIDTETGWRFAGPCTKRIRTYRRKTSTGTDDLELELRGVDMMDHLDALLDWPDPLNTANWYLVVNAAGSTISTSVTNTLDFNGGGSALVARRIPDLEIITTTPPIGPVKDYNISSLPLNELWNPWFVGTDFTYRLALFRDPTGPGTAASVRFTVTTRQVAPQIITPSMMDAITVTETAASTTFAVVMGEQIAAQPVGVRHVATATTPSTSWLTRRRETFANRPAATLASAQGEANDMIAAGAPKLHVEIADFELPGYGFTARLGDYVQVNYDSNEAVVFLPIVSSRLTGGPTGFRRLVSVGRENLIGPRQIAANNETLAKRVRRLEGQLRL